MAISRAERRTERRGRVAATFGESHVEAALDLLELMEFAWHDCYGDTAPPDDVVDDVLACSRGELARLVKAVRLGVEDPRDLKLWADDERSGCGR